jgi:putative ABC transport system permease protein
MRIIVRTARATSEVLGVVRASVASLDATLPVIDVETAPELIATSVRPQRLTGAVIGAFAISALLLAAIGLYGVIAYTVSQRRQELGIRAALGAQAGDLVALVLVESAGITALGILVGALASLAASRLLAAYLFGVSATDPTVLASVAGVVACVALLSSAVPTLRATRANPLDTLRGAQ